MTPLLKRLSLVTILLWNNLQTKHATFDGIDLCQAFNHDGLGALINLSIKILYALFYQIHMLCVLNTCTYLEDELFSGSSRHIIYHMVTTAFQIIWNNLSKKKNHLK